MKYDIVDLFYLDYLYGANPIYNFDTEDVYVLGNNLKIQEYKNGDLVPMFDVLEPVQFKNAYEIQHLINAFFLQTLQLCKNKVNVSKATAMANIYDIAYNHCDNKYRCTNIAGCIDYTSNLFTKPLMNMNYIKSSFIKENIFYIFKEPEDIGVICVDDNNECVGFAMTTNNIIEVEIV